MASHFDFVDLLVATRGLVVTRSDARGCRRAPRRSALAWYCDLDDGTPPGENDPASFVRWVCPTLRIEGPVTGEAIPPLDVRRSGPQSDLGKLMNAISRLVGRPATGDGDVRFVYTDPAGVLDAELRRRIENWPSARHGDGVVRPAELSSIKRTREGLVVESVSWWGSAPVLDHQIALAVDIAHRLTLQR